VEIEEGTQVHRRMRIKKQKRYQIRKQWIQRGPIIGKKIVAEK
jgi:hypothetical protein